MQQGHILLVEDNPHMRQILSLVLEKGGYTVTQASDGRIAVDLLLVSSHQMIPVPYEVVLTDIIMDDVDGIQVMKVARSLSVPPEVILLTGHGTLETAMDAIRAGAFDYLLKPCENALLLERIAAALDFHRKRVRQARESQVLHTMTTFLKDNPDVIATTPQELEPLVPLHTTPPKVHTSDEQKPGQRYLWVGKLCVDTYRREVWLHQQQVNVTPNEYGILHCLMNMAGRAMSFSEIVRCTRGYATHDDEAKELLRQHILNLRKKLDRRYIISVYGIGYMLVAPEDTTPEDHE